MSELQPFEANGMPLSPGIRLLEASAGTGKTFALAHLVLRLLSEGARPLTIEQLLVVTFTEAAAAELRDRIARRLQAALGLLEAERSARSMEPPAPPADQPLAQWRQALGQDPDPALRGRLLLALEQLDRADITTIHGFCRRTLQRQALEAGLGPAVALEGRAAERRSQIVHDYWQQQVLPLPAADLAGLLARQVEPERLSQLLLQLDGDPALSLEPLPAGVSQECPLAAQWQQQRLSSWQQFQTCWSSRAEQLEQDLAATASAAKPLGIDYKPYRLKPKPDKLQRVEQWLAEHADLPGYDAVLAVKELREYFHPGSVQRLEAAVHGEGVRLPQAELLAAIADLVDGPAELLLLHFAHWGRAELARRRARSGEMGFGQLLERLDPGPQAAGSAPTPLLQAVANRYRAALIDEFQDTDPIQWRILQTSFSGTPQRHLLVMVGDPKQAIYRFRGGELATYRQAAAEADARYGLIENRRSSEALIAGLNALMRPGLVASGLTVPTVLARARGEQLLLPDDQQPLQLLPLEPEQLEQRVAACCQALLSAELRLKRADAARPLTPGDLCLLVNRHSEAEALRLALEQRGLPSRLVNQGDVFASEGALALQRLLDALAHPGDPGRLRLLAASPLLGWSAARIVGGEPGQWDALAGQVSRLAALVPQQGITAALGQLLGSEGLAGLALRGRALADLQQAAELLQEQMHRQGLAAAAAADWLRNLRLQDERDLPEAHLCRSDAAESAIAVVTVHRSKGLEYPVVICPYLWKGRRPPRTGQIGRRWRPPGSDRPRLDLHLNPHWGLGRAAAADDAEADRQEAERRAYVACTRARHLLVLGWPGPERAEPGNPLGPWLEERTAGPEAAIPLSWIDPASLPPADQRWRPLPPAGALELGPLPERPLDSRWGRASYSAWTHGEGPPPAPASEEGRDTDDPAAEPEGAGLSAVVERAPMPEGNGPLALFPRGAGPGDALHRMLEQINYPALAGGDRDGARPLVLRELERAGLAETLGDAVLTAFEQLVLSPLGGPLQDFRLADLAAGSWLNEMAFDLPLAVLEATGAQRLVRSRGLAAAFREHPGGRFGAAYAKALEGLAVASRGFLTGSIDLVFRCGDRWWVADWKSNWLGLRDSQGQTLRCGPSDYSQEAMTALMASHHYPLQAHLYLVALHRYLRWRLPGYQPERHLGGYAYLFLRGMPGPLPAAADSLQAGVSGALVERPPLQRLLALDRLLREGEP